MTYQQVVNLIRATAGTVNPSGTFIHGMKLHTTTGSINETDPIISVLPFVTTKPDGSVGYVTEHKIQIGFWQQDKTDSSVLEQEAIIAAMDVLSRDFELELNLTESIEITGLRKEPDYRQLMGTMSGYLMEFTIKSGVDVCA